MYHSGATQDIDWLVPQLIGNYQKVALIGYSLGGNILLKYLSESPSKLDEKISMAVAVSTPANLSTCCAYLCKPGNFIYQQYFLRSLREKLKHKKQRYPDDIDLKPLKKIRNLKQFDDHYTAPIHGFKDAEDYYAKCSSINRLDSITIPTLMLSSLDDPFLDPDHHPISLAQKSDILHLVLTQYGGHVGFDNTDSYLSDELSIQFIEDIKI